MIETTKKTVEVKVNKIICDFCGKEITREYSDKKCVMCGRHVCTNCSGDIDESGDYSEHMCKECWDIGLPFRLEIRKLKGISEQLEEEFDRLCKENKLKPDTVKECR